MRLEGAVASVWACCVLQAAAGPELSGPPDELTAYLGDLPGQITLTGEAERKVEADRAEMVIRVRNSDRALQTALVQNQQLRAEIVTALEKSGIPGERIRMSKFSSTPTQGLLSSKVKAYEIESRVTIEAVSEKELQAVAALVDEREEIGLQSLAFTDTRKAQHESEVLADALAKVKSLQALYEKALGVTLAPRAVGPATERVPPSWLRRRGYVPRDVSALSMPMVREAPATLHALEQREADITQFDQIIYSASISVTFDVWKAEKP